VSLDAPGTVADEDRAAARDGTGGRGHVAPWVVLAVAVLVLGLVVVLIAAGPDDGTPTSDSPLLGRPAPEAVGELDDGRPFDLSRRKGSWVLLNFFTADCVPCIQEHPELVEFAEQQEALGDDGAELYSVVVNDTRADVEEFFAERGGDWPVVYPADGSAIDVAFGVAAVPETWIVDPDGVVRLRLVSKVTAEGLNVTMQQLREAIG
jgi:cytochrome c biogenesis protein CcmG/thiol:disulfide interchange protein DsbE